MTSILIASLPADHETAARMRDELQSRFDDVSLIDPGQTPDAIDAAIDDASALLVLVSAGWPQQIASQPTLAHAVENGLRHSALPVIAVLLDGAALPAVTALPETLRALAYMTAVSVNPGASFARDTLLLARQIESYFEAHRREPDAQARVGAEHQRREGRVPWNLVIIGTALVLGLAVLIASAGRGAYPAGGLLPLSGTTATPRPVDAALAAEPDIDLALGVVAGLTGDEEAQGIAMIRAAELALADRPQITVNDVSFRVELLALDSPCSAAGGVRAAEALVENDTIAGVIGHMCDISCSTSAPIYAAASYTTVSPACRAPELANTPHTSFNRVVPSAAYVSEAAARFVAQTLDAPRVAVVHDELIRNRAIGQTFAEAYDGPLAGVFPVISANLDADAVATEIRAESPAVVYYVGRPSTAAALASRLDGVTFVLAERAIAAEFVELAGADAEGAYVLDLLPPAGDALDELAARYADLYETVPESAIYAYTYDAVNLLLDGLEAAGTTGLDGEFVLDRGALQAFVRAYSGAGVTGPLACDGSGDCASAALAVFVIRDGALVAEG